MSFSLHFSCVVSSVVLYLIFISMLQRCKASGFCSHVTEISILLRYNTVLLGNWFWNLLPVDVVSYPRRIETSFTSIRHFSRSFSDGTCLQKHISEAWICLISICDYPNFTSIQASRDGLFVWEISFMYLFGFYNLEVLVCNCKWSGTWNFWCSYGICCIICLWQICSTDTHFACPWLTFNNLFLHMQMHMKKHP
jgi:hypothetical protein